MTKSSASGAVLLIDADVPIYAAASEAQRLYDWDGDGEVSVAVDDIEEVLRSFMKTVDRYVDELHADRAVLCVSDNENFRKAILPSYKASRKVKPVHVLEARRLAVERFGAYQRPTLEGDDVLGILATHPTLIPGDKVIVSIDKDLRQIPGTLWNPDTGVLCNLDAATCDYWHMVQTLTGDAVDEYKGCPGIGPIKATKILEAGGPTLLHAWTAVAAAYVSKGLTEDDALVQARVARILRHTDYDFHTKRPLLWQPPAK